MDIVLVVILLVFLLDIAVLWNIIRTKSSLRNKLLYSLIIILFPIIGVSIYYIIRK